MSTGKDLVAVEGAVVHPDLDWLHMHWVICMWVTQVVVFEEQRRLAVVIR